MRAPLLLVTVLAFGCNRDQPTSAIPEPNHALADLDRDHPLEPLVCRGRLDAEDLLPADAVFVAAYDMERERRHAPRVSASESVGPRALMPIELEAIRLGWISIAAACELDEGYWGEAWVAIDREQEALLTLSGNGIGDQDALWCIKGRLSQLYDDFGSPMVIRPDGCGVQLEYEDLAGFAPHDDLLVLGTRAAVDRARYVWNHRAASPPEHLLPTRRRKGYVWAAVDVPALLSPDEMQAALAGADDDVSALASLRTVTFDAQLGRRLTLELGASFGREADARAIEAVARALIEAPPPALPGWARTLITRIEPSRDDRGVGLSATLQRDTAHELGLLPTQTEAAQVPAFAWALGLAFL